MRIQSIDKSVLPSCPDYGMMVRGHDAPALGVLQRREDSSSANASADLDGDRRTPYTLPSASTQPPLIGRSVGAQAELLQHTPPTYADMSVGHGNWLASMQSEGVACTQLQPAPGSGTQPPGLTRMKTASMQPEDALPHRPAL